MRFFIVIHRFSLVNAVMNAPRLCKLRNGVYKTPQFLNFPISKGRTKTIVNWLLNWQLKNKETL
jgi:hypothetical protein